MILSINEEVVLQANHWQNSFQLRKILRRLVGLTIWRIFNFSPWRLVQSIKSQFRLKLFQDIGNDGKLLVKKLNFKFRFLLVFYIVVNYQISSMTTFWLTNLIKLSNQLIMPPSDFDSNQWFPLSQTNDRVMMSFFYMLVHWTSVGKYSFTERAWKLLSKM